MPIITVDMWDIHDKPVMKKIIENLTKGMVDAIGCPPEAVHVIIHKVPKENWGIAGKPCE